MVKEKLLERVFPVPSASVLCPGRPCLAGTRHQVRVAHLPWT